MLYHALPCFTTLLIGFYGSILVGVATILWWVCCLHSLMERERERLHWPFRGRPATVAWKTPSPAQRCHQMAGGFCIGLFHVQPKLRLFGLMISKTLIFFGGWATDECRAFEHQVCTFFSGIFLYTNPQRYRKINHHYFGLPCHTLSLLFHLNLRVLWFSMVFPNMFPLISHRTRMN